MCIRDRDKAGSAKVNKSGPVKKLTVTTNNRIKAGFNSVRRTKAKKWTQNQFTNRMHNYQKTQLENFKPLWKYSKRFIPPQTDGWSVFTLTLVVLNPKKFSSDEKTTTTTKTQKKKPLRGANVRTSCISFSLSQNSHRTRQTNAGDKGCAEACAERLSALKDQHWRHVVSSLSRGHFRNVFVKFSEMLGFWSFIFL